MITTVLSKNQRPTIKVWIAKLKSKSPPISPEFYAYLKGSGSTYKSLHSHYIGAAFLITVSQFLSLFFHSFTIHLPLDPAFQS